MKCIITLGQEEPFSEKASYNKLTIGIVGYKYEPRVNSFSLVFEECKLNKNNKKLDNEHPVVHGKNR